MNLIKSNNSLATTSSTNQAGNIMITSGLVTTGVWATAALLPFVSLPGLLITLLLLGAFLKYRN